MKMFGGDPHMKPIMQSLEIFALTQAVWLEK